LDWVLRVDGNVSHAGRQQGGKQMYKIKRNHEFDFGFAPDCSNDAKRNDEFISFKKCVLSEEIGMGGSEG
jgi:hypothetical protein